MKHFSKILFSLVLSVLCLAGCILQPQAPNGEVNSISIINAKDTIYYNETIELSVDISVSGDTSKLVTWSTSNSNIISISSTSGEKITIRGVDSGEAKITVTSDADPSKYSEQTIIVSSHKKEWSEEDIKVMSTRFRTIFPFIDGNFTTWDDTNFKKSEYIECYSPVANDYDLAINCLKNVGYLENDETIENGICLYKEQPEVYSENCFILFYIIKKDNGVSIKAAYGYEPITTNIWPEEKLNRVTDMFPGNEREYFPVPVATSYTYGSDYLHYGAYITVYGSLVDYIEKIVSEDWAFIRSYSAGYDYYLSPKSSLCMYIMSLNKDSFYIQAGATGTMPN